MTERAIRNILVVDDSDHFRSMLVKFLKSKGYACTNFSDASKALNAIKNNQYDLVIAEFMMPGMNAIELLESSKKEFPDLEFIITCTRKGEIKYADIISAGAIDYLKKPFDMEELTVRIDRLDREIENVRELKAVKRKLEDAVIIAENAQIGSIAKSGFLADMSHEIRTPLNSIIGFAEMLMDTKLSHEQRGYSRTIQNESESLLVLIDDILDF
jgi:DNA-binding response OmpR family regulator